MSLNSPDKRNSKCTAACRKSHTCHGCCSSSLLDSQIPRHRLAKPCRHPHGQWDQWNRPVMTTQHAASMVGRPHAHTHIHEHNVNRQRLTAHQSLYHTISVQFSPAITHHTNATKDVPLPMNNRISPWVAFMINITRCINYCMPLFGWFL